jgi:Na+/proline symporter
MLLAIAASIILIMDDLELNTRETVDLIAQSKYSQMFFWDWRGPQNFFKQFFAGAFIAIVMTGLDQDMMQKNLTCRNLKDAQKNMFWFSSTLVFVNLFILALGALLYLYAEHNGIPIPGRSDDLFPVLAVNHFSVFAGIMFLLGITAAAYSSADSALTSLTTSFCVDFLNFQKSEIKNETQTRIKVHLGFSVLIFIVIMIFQAINDESVISAVFTAAGYTYGPLLGLFSFGLFTKRQVVDRAVPFICVISPILSYLININSKTLLNGYEFGFEILLVNGALTFIGLLIFSSKTTD